MNDVIRSDMNDVIRSDMNDVIRSDMNDVIRSDMRGHGGQLPNHIFMHALNGTKM